MEAESMKVGEGWGCGFSDLLSRLLFQTALVSLVLISASYALYEDQMGRFDWRREYVGRVKLWSVEPRPLGASGPSKALYVATEANVVAALDPHTGALLWRAVLEVGRFDWRREYVGRVKLWSVEPRPLGASGPSKALYVATEANVVAALDPHTGALLWRAVLEVGRFDWRREYVGRVKLWSVEPRPLGASGPSKALYVATEANVVAALDPHTGALLWRAVLEVGRFDWRREYVGRVKLWSVEPRPLRASGPSKALYVATEANVVAALDPHTGALLWRAVLEVGRFDWRREYVGRVKLWSVEPRPLGASGPSKALYVATEANVVAALDPHTGALLWRAVLEVGRFDWRREYVGRVKLWSVEPRPLGASGPSKALYVATEANVVAALDPHTGALLWRAVLEVGRFDWRREYVGRVKLWSVEPRPLGASGPSKALYVATEANVVAALDPHTGALLWRAVLEVGRFDWRREYVGRVKLWSVEPRPLGASGPSKALYVATEANVVAALDPHTGALLWRAVLEVGRFDWRREYVGRVKLWSVEPRPLGASGPSKALYVATEANVVAALDPHTGALLWRAVLEVGRFDWRREYVGRVKLWSVEPRPLGASGPSKALYVATEANVVAALDPHTGALLWRAVLEVGRFDWRREYVGRVKLWSVEPRPLGASGPSKALYVATEANVVAALDPHTGALLWRAVLEVGRFDWRREYVGRVKLWSVEPRPLGASGPSKALYVATEANVVAALDPHTGALLWRAVLEVGRFDWRREYVGRVKLWSVEPRPLGASGPSKALYVATEANVVAALDPHTGALLWRAVLEVGRFDWRREYVGRVKLWSVEPRPLGASGPSKALYVATEANVVAALDPHTGALLWRAVLEVGRFDWRREYVGRVKLWSVEPRPLGASGPSKALYVATEANVVAALDPHTGALLWRAVLEVGRFDWRREYVGRVKLWSVEPRPLGASGPSKALYVATEANVVAALDPHTGALLWRAVLEVGRFDWRREYVGRVKLWSVEPRPLGASGPSKALYVATEANVVAALDPHTGALLWRAVLEVGRFDWRREYVGRVKLWSVEPRPLGASGPSKALYVATEANVVAALDPHTGALLWRAILEVGRFDWRREYVGRVKLWSVEPRPLGASGPSKALYVATEANVVAALDPHTGALLWRAVLEDPSHSSTGERRGMAALVSTGRSVGAVAEGGRWTRVWEGRTGLLKWEALTSDRHCPDVAATIDSANGNIIILRCGLLSAYGLEDGEPMWDADLPLLTSSRDLRWTALAAADRSVSVFAGRPGASLTTVLVDAANGKLKATDTQPAAWFHPDRCHLAAAHLVCPDQAKAEAKLVAAGATRAEIKEGPKKAGPNLRIWALDGGYYGLSVDQSFAVYKLGSTEALVSLDFVPLEARVATLKGVDYLGTVREGKADVQELEWQALGAGGGKKMVSKWGVGPTRARVASGAPLVGKGELGWALLCEDGVVTSGSGGWSRHEALADVLSLEMVDLPLSEAQASVETEFSEDDHSFVSQLRHRLSSQYEQLLRTLRLTVDELMAFDLSTQPLFAGLGLGGSKASSSAKAMPGKLERDRFNLNKVLVMSTAAGKLYGLDSRDGRILWELWPEGLAPLTNAAGVTELPVILQRSTAHFPHPAQALAVGKDRATGKGLVVRFEPISGRLLGEERLGLPLKGLMVLPYSTAEGLTAVMLVGKDDECLVLPSEAELPDDPAIFYFSVEPSSGQTRGLRLVKGLGSKGWVLEEAWSARLPLTESQAVVRVAGKRLAERLHSPGRALGDRSVLYKYANPNLVAVMALSPEVVGAGAGGAPAGGLLSLFLLDGVTGELLHSLQHPRVTEPLHLVHSENWLVYSFWNEKARRTEVATLELYEGQTQAQPSTFSSFAAQGSRPLVLPQSYVFQQGISALGLTETEKGMTNRQLLFAMPFGGVLEMPKGLLDPRRSLVPTPEMREEGLIPYIPELPIATEHIVNYNQSLMRVRAIDSRPGGLESTALLFVRGLDLYFTRLTPSGTFDVLKDDFDHWLIALVLTALAVATLVSRRLARSRELNQNWK